MIPVFVALDFDSEEKARELVRKLKNHCRHFKIGLELIHSVGTKRAIEIVKEESSDASIFLDVKLCDIPNTVASAVKTLVKLGVDYITVHASSGSESLKAAVQEKQGAKILAVTILTSFTESDCLYVFGKRPEMKVLEFGHMAQTCGADGIICSPLELKPLASRKDLVGLLRVVPGIRPTWAIAKSEKNSNDQKRIMTPKEAETAGANFLVVGRPVTNPPAEIGGPVEAYQKLF